MSVRRHVSVSVLSRLRGCLWRASHVCPVSLSLPVLRLLLSVLDDKAVPAVPEDDGKLSVGPVLIDTLAVCFCVCLLFACRRSSVSLHLGVNAALTRPVRPFSLPLFRVGTPHVKGDPRRCMWTFECLFSAGLSHFVQTGLLLSRAPASSPVGHLQVQTACRQLSPRPWRHVIRGND